MPVSTAARALAEESARPAPRLHVVFSEGDGLAAALAHLRHVLESEPAAGCMLFHASRRLDAIRQLEDAEALKNIHLDRLAMHFFLTEEKQDIELYDGALDAHRLRRIFDALVDPGDVDACAIFGPPGMATSVGSVLRELGIAPECISIPEPGEPEPAPGSSEPGVNQAQGRESVRPPATEPPRPAVVSGDCAVTIVMDGRSRAFTMDSSETVLEAAERNGISLPFSCRGGVCSTCRARLLRGTVSMDANYALEEWEVEAGFILACQSHPQTPELALTYDER